MSLKSSNLTETNTYELEVAVDGKVFSEAVDKVFKKQAKKINVPGFRKGKAPRAIIEKMYGEDVFFDDAMQDCYPAALEDAAKEAGVKIVTVTKLEAQEVSIDGFTFKATVVVEPEVEIENYKGIEVEKKSTEVTEEMINEEIEKVRERNSRMVTVEDRSAENGDTVVIDFEGFCDGVAFEGGKAENYNLELGSNSFIPGFEDQLVGHNTDEEFTIDVKFPEEYQAENLKGKDAQFKIKLHEIKKKELPEVDDEFVKDVSEKETLEEYKEEIKETIAKRLEDEAERAIDDKLVEVLLENMKGEIPEAMFDNEVNTMLREFDMRLRSQGMDMTTYLKYTGMEPEAVKQMYKPEAERRVKMRLILEKIVKLENIKPTEEDIDAEYAKLADMYQMDKDKVKEIIPAENLTEDLAVEQAMKFVKDNAVIK
ncbi:MAG: trigger factor [Oscillospiraceae bacterium]|nr:trigger factor [Candidatus Ruminococcus equi]